MPIFTKLNSIRHSVNNPFVSSKHRSTSPPPPSSTTITSSQQTYAASPYSRSSLSAFNLSQHYQPKQSTSLNQEPRQRVTSTPTASFAETLKVISKQVQQDQFEDVFGSFFFTEKRCQHRATFMTARLMQNLARTTDLAQHSDSFWKTLIDRFYTLNYLLFVIPSSNRTRASYLMALEQRMKADRVGHYLKDRRGGMETYFALYYAMVKQQQQQHQTQQDVADDIYVVEQARKILEHCLDSEGKLGHTERDAMYIFHSLRAGLHGHDDAKVMLDDDDLLLALIDDAVQNNKKLANHPYVNPFEDDACIVDDSDDDDGIGADGMDSHGSHHQVDSGFYDGVMWSNRNSGVVTDTSLCGHL